MQPEQFPRSVETIFETGDPPNLPTFKQFKVTCPRFFIVEEYITNIVFALILACFILLFPILAF
jgi:hypothetical protein